jgi:hypothetical protein
MEAGHSAGDHDVEPLSFSVETGEGAHCFFQVLFEVLFKKVSDLFVFFYLFERFTFL